jgi:hypothetical protein
VDRKIVAVIVVVAAASAPVAAWAETPSFNYTRLAVTYTIQNDVAPPAMQPR